MPSTPIRETGYVVARAGFIVAGIIFGLTACAAPDTGRIPEDGAIARPRVETPPPAVQSAAQQQPQVQYQVPEGFQSRLSTEAASANPTEAGAPSVQPPTTVIDGREEGKVRVALLLPLSGRAETIGRAMMNIATLAVFDLADDRFDLRPLDTRGTPEGARAAAERAELILGPLFSSSFAAVVPVAQAAGINIVGFTNDLAVAAPGAFVMGFTPEQQIDRVVDQALQSGAQRFAALLPGNAYGQRVAQALRAALAYRGGAARDIVYYDPAAEDIAPIVRQLADYDEREAELKRQRAELAGKTDELSKTVLKRLENLDTVGDPDFDAILLAEGGARQRAIAALLPFYDIDPGRVRVMGTFLWDEDTSIGSEPALTGGWYAAPERAGRHLAQLPRCVRRHPAAARLHRL